MLERTHTQTGSLTKYKAVLCRTKVLFLLSYQTWLDDQFLVSGSRDGSIALWRVTDEMIEQVTSADIPTTDKSICVIISSALLHKLVMVTVKESIDDACEKDSAMFYLLQIIVTGV